jgi:DNA repair protein RadC
MPLGLEEHRLRLRERFERSGFDGFHDHEVLELVLTYALPRKDVKQIARELLNQFGTIASVFDAPVKSLQQIPGIKQYTAVFLTLIPRLIERYQHDRWKENRIFNSTQQAVSYLSSIMGAERNEVFCLLALNSRNALIATEEIQRGSVNRTAVFPRLVVEAVLKHRATAVIFAHNHPGGDPTPSQADKLLTQRLKKILIELDIIVHDHIIIAGPNSFSFSEHGEL